MMALLVMFVRIARMALLASPPAFCITLLKRVLATGVLGVSLTRSRTLSFSPDYSVRRDKALFLSGCESRPATVAPAGSSRSGRWR